MAAPAKKKNGPARTKKSRAKPDYQHRHPFPVTILGPNGQFKIVKAMAVVKTPRQSANVIVLADHVKMARENNACGNSSLCTMANAVAANASAFSHKVTGTIDFHNMTAFVVSKEKDGMPVECYRYVHSSEVPKLNDTEGGMELLEEKLAEEGAMEVLLSPRPRRFYERKGGTGKTTDGSRSSRARTRPEHSRHMIAMRGGHPELVAKHRDALVKRMATKLNQVRKSLADKETEE